MHITHVVGQAAMTHLAAGSVLLLYHCSLLDALAFSILLFSLLHQTRKVFAFLLKKSQTFEDGAHG